MSLVPRRWPALLAVGVAVLLAQSVVCGGDKEPAKRPAPASNLDLTPERMPKLHALVRPQETEWRHLKVQWLTDVIAARKLAAEEDRPLVVLYTGGAGYNEPLGVC
jgi:hypothetical protein